MGIDGYNLLRLQIACDDKEAQGEPRAEIRKVAQREYVNILIILGTGYSSIVFVQLMDYYWRFLVKLLSVTALSWQRLTTFAAVGEVNFCPFRHQLGK